MRQAILLAASALLALTPAALAAEPDLDLGDLDGTCYGYRVGWSGYYRHCVNPDRPDCLYETYFWSGADEFHSCTGIQH